MKSGRSVSTDTATASEGAFAGWSSLVTDPPLPAAAAQFLVVGEVARWQLAAAATCRMLLAPGWVPGMINTSRPWAAGA